VSCDLQLVANIKTSNIVIEVFINCVQRNGFASGGEIEFRLPSPSARKGTKFLINHNASLHTTCVAYVQATK
jgi:hypothetical protein